MARVELKIELMARYCPICRIETQHAILFQLVRPDGRPSGRNSRKRSHPEELLSACAICNADRFWALRFATAADAQKFIEEGWTTRIGHAT